MTEQVQNMADEPISDWVEVGAEQVAAEESAEQEQSSEVDSVDVEQGDDVELVIDGQAVSPAADADVNVPDDAPNWAKELRTKYKETARKAAELEKQLQQQKQHETEPEIQDEPMPTMDDPDVSWDPELLAKKMAVWAKKQTVIEQQKEAKKAAEQAELAELQKSVERYHQKKAEIVAKAPDYSSAEDKVKNSLSVQAQNVLLDVADNAAAIVLAAGRNDSLLQELVALQSNPVKFAAKIGALNKSVGFAPKPKQQFEPEPKTKAAVTKPQSADDARFSAAFPDAKFI